MPRPVLLELYVVMRFRETVYRDGRIIQLVYVICRPVIGKESILAVVKIPLYVLINT